jgi:hypothetical protein
MDALAEADMLAAPSCLSSALTCRRVVRERAGRSSPWVGSDYLRKGRSHARPHPALLGALAQACSAPARDGARAPHPHAWLRREGRPAPVPGPHPKRPAAVGGISETGVLTALPALGGAVGGRPVRGWSCSLASPWRVRRVPHRRTVSSVGPAHRSRAIRHRLPVRCPAAHLGPAHPAGWAPCGRAPPIGGR